MRVPALLFAVLLGATPAAAQNSQPAGSLDAPSDAATIGTTFVLDGWAVDRGATTGPGVDVVHIYVSGPFAGGSAFLAAAFTGRSRPDVGAAFGSQFINSGFRVQAYLPPGTYRVDVYAHSTVSNAFALDDTANVTVVSPMLVRPLGVSSAGNFFAGNFATVAFDDKHDAYLHVWSDGSNTLLRLISLDGSPIGGSTVLGPCGNVPQAAYSKGTVDDAFVVVCGTTAMVLRYSPAGPSVIGTLSFSGETLDDVVFNSRTGRFLVLSECRTQVDGCTITARHIAPDGGVGSPVSINPSGSRSTQAMAAYDAVRNRYGVTFDDVVLPLTDASPREKYVLQLDGSTAAPLTSALWSSCTSNTCPGLFPTGVLIAFLPDLTRFMVFYSRGDDFNSFEVNNDGTTGQARRVPAQVKWSTTARADYDPVTHRLLLTGRNDTTGVSADSAVRATLLDGQGNVLVRALNLPTIGSTAPAAVRFSRDGQFAIASVVEGTGLPGKPPTPSQILLERFTLSAVSGSVDEPSGGAVSLPFDVSGWAIEAGSASGTGIDAIHVWAFPSGGGAPTFAGSAGTFTDRADLASFYGLQFARSGYRVTVASLAPGSYRLIAYAHSELAGSFSQIGFVDVVLSAPVSNPAMALDGPVNNASPSQPFLAGGWAVDLGAPSGVGVDAVHVWAFPVSGAAPIFVAAGTGGGSRPDVGAVFGSRFTNSGYTFTISNLPPGVYDLGVYARSTVTGTFNQMRIVRITIN